MALTTTGFLKTHLGITTTDLDTRLTQWIDVASEAVEGFCKRIFAVADYTVDLNGSGRQTLILPQFPIISLTSVKVDAARAFGASTILTVDEHFIVDNPSGTLTRMAACWPKGTKNIRVVFRAGYEAASIPKDLQQAVAEVAIDRMIRGRSAEDGGAHGVITAESIPGLGATSYEPELDHLSGFPVSVARLLRNKYASPV